MAVQVFITDDGDHFTYADATDWEVHGLSLLHILGTDGTKVATHSRWWSVARVADKPPLDRAVELIEEAKATTP